MFSNNYTVAAVVTGSLALL